MTQSKEIIAKLDEILTILKRAESRQVQIKEKIEDEPPPDNFTSAYSKR